MTKTIIIAAAFMMSFGWAQAQQANPIGYDPALAHLIAPDGTNIQVLDSTGAFDGAATASAYAAYVAANPQPTRPGPSLVTKLGFIRLMTATERAAFIVAQDQATALTAAQESLSPLPAQTQALIGLKVFLAEYNALQPGDTINLTDPSTASAVNLFLALGIVTSQARVTAILAGQAPSP
jgi:hypothetical protein